MTIEVTAQQLSGVAAQVNWVTDDADPVAGFDVSVDIASAGFVGLGIRSGTARTWLDTPALWVPGQTVQYRVTDLDTLVVGLADVFTASDPTLPYTFGPVNVLATAARYTSLDEVKDRLGITNAEKDDYLLSSIIAAESAIDQVNQRSLPDQGTNPEISGVPEAIRQWATDASIAIWKAADAPFGQGGGDAWLGSLDVQNITERVLRRHPLALGYKVAWGVA